MDILELLKKYGAELPDDKKAEFDKDFRKAFKSAAEVQKIRLDLSSAQSDLEKANEIIAATKDRDAKTGETEAKYKAEIEDYKKQLADIHFSQLLDAELKGIEFSSDRVRSSVISDIKAKGFEEKDGKLAGLSDYLKGLYSTEPTSFKSVDNQIHTWGAPASAPKDKQDAKPDYFGRII